MAAKTWLITLVFSVGMAGACNPQERDRSGVTSPGNLRIPQVQVWQGEWHGTDFTRASVNLSEIVSGGPPRDGIPPIDHPKFVSVKEAGEWIDAQEPVLVYRQGGEARAYPLQILIWHEIVNDVVGGIPVLITFCPLCYSLLVFDRRVDGKVLDFGTTGKLRNSDLIMWDRQTESWWQQLTGEGIVGKYTGVKLKFLPAPMVSFGTFRNAYADGQVLSRDTGHSRPYGTNPYTGYDSPQNTQPFMMRNPVDSRLPATERVVTLEWGSEFRAYPYSLLAQAGVANDRLGGRDFVIFFRKGTVSALDGRVIATSRDVGSGTAFDRAVEGRPLTFRAKDGYWEDQETGSRWNQFGRAIAGKMRGKQLTSVNHGNHFAFAWFAFRPQSTVWKNP